MAPAGPRGIVKALAPFLLAVLFVAGISVGAARPSPVPASVPLPGPRALEPHAPISIDGDVDFTLANGVRSGSGTPADPYVISDWEINASAANGISVRYENASFVIRDVRVHSGADRWHGIALQWNGTDWFGRGGMRVVMRTTLEDVDDGVWVRYVRGLSIQYNVIDRIHGFGIHLDQSDNVTISWNRVGGIPRGWSVLYFTNVADVSVAWNWLGPSGGGGITLTYTERVRIFGNDIVGIASHSAWKSDDGGGTTWDAGYEGGGNYWVDYGGVDLCRGEAQDDCSAPDGIGDTPFTGIGGYGGQDRFPLVGATAFEGLPILVPLPVFVATVGDPIPVTAEIVLPSPSWNLRVWYRGPLETAFASESLHRTDAPAVVPNASVYEAVLPAPSRTGSLLYFFTAEDPNGTVVRGPQRGAETIEISDRPLLSNPLALALIVGTGAGVLIAAYLALVRRRGRRPPGNP